MVRPSLYTLNALDPSLGAKLRFKWSGAFLVATGVRIYNITDPSNPTLVRRDCFPIQTTIKTEYDILPTTEQHADYLVSDNIYTIEVCGFVDGEELSYDSKSDSDYSNPQTIYALTENPINCIYPLAYSDGLNAITNRSFYIELQREYTVKKGYTNNSGLSSYNVSILDESNSTIVEWSGNGKSDGEEVSGEYDSFTQTTPRTWALNILCNGLENKTNYKIIIKGYTSLNKELTTVIPIYTDFSIPTLFSDLVIKDYPEEAKQVIQANITSLKGEMEDGALAIFTPYPADSEHIWLDLRDGDTVRYDNDFILSDNYSLYLDFRNPPLHTVFFTIGNIPSNTFTFRVCSALSTRTDGIVKYYIEMKNTAYLENFIIHSNYFDLPDSSQEISMRVQKVTNSTFSAAYGVSVAIKEANS